MFYALPHKTPPFRCKEFFIFFWFHMSYPGIFKAKTGQMIGCLWMLWILWGNNTNNSRNIWASSYWELLLRPLRTKLLGSYLYTLYFGGLYILTKLNSVSELILFPVRKSRKIKDWGENCVLHIHNRLVLLVLVVKDWVFCENGKEMRMI